MSNQDVQRMTCEKPDSKKRAPGNSERIMSQHLLLKDEEVTNAREARPKEEQLTQPTSLPELRRATSNALQRKVSRMTNRDIIDPGPAPDGGVKAWTQVAMAWIVCLTTWGYINSFGIFQTYYTDTLGESQSTISWVGSVQLWVIFFMSAFSGRALDAGLFIPTFFVGSVIQLLGIFMNSFCKNFRQLLLAQGLCTGLGSGIIFCPAMGLVTTYFEENRALAVAIVTTGNSAGGLIYPIIVQQLLPRVGFAWTVRVLGFVNMACLGTALAFMRPRLPPRKSGPVIEWSAFREVPFVLMVAGMSCIFGGLFFSYYYLASYGRTIIGMSYPDSVNLLILFNGIGIPIRLISGFLADKYTGPLNAIIPLLFLNSLFAFVWIGVSSRIGLYVFASFYGMSAGAFQCLFPTTLTSLSNDMSKNGVRLGMAFSIFSVAGLVGPPIGGQLLSTNGGEKGGYLSAQLGLGFATAFGACLVVGARVYKDGWSLKIKC